MKTEITGNEPEPTVTTNMQKKEYERLLQLENKQIDDCRERIKLYTEEYINSNKQFNIGDRIKITTPAHEVCAMRSNEKTMHPESSRFAYVSGIKINWQNDIEYQVRKEKKDGTMSLVNDCYSDRDILTLAKK